MEKGIKALYENVQGFKAPFATTCSPNVTIPMTMREREVVFYTVAVEAGKSPPISSLSELTANSQYVIMFDRKTVTVH